jgi:hypothetical protein
VSTVSSLLAVNNDPETGSGIFDIIELVFLSLASRVCQEEGPSCSLSTKHIPVLEKLYGLLVRCFFELSTMSEYESLFCTVGRAQIPSDDGELLEVLLSVSSLLLCVLVSTLELVAEK